MPRAYLHIGAHKTGTSAFQSFMLQHRDWLLKRNLYVPRTGQSRSGAHHKLASAISGLPNPKHTIKLPSTLKQELLEAGYPDIIVSSESIHHHMSSMRSVEKYYNFFDEIGYEITFIYYLRIGLSVYGSTYSQVVKNLNISENISEFIERKLSVEKFPVWKMLLAQDRAQTIIRPYDRNVQTTGIVKELLAEIGIHDQSPPTSQINSSPSWVEVYLCRSLAQAMLQQGFVLDHSRQHAPIRQSLLAELNQVMLDWDGDRSSYYGITDEMAAQIEARAGAQWTEMSQSLWNMPWEAAFPGECGRRLRVNDPDIVSLSARDRAVLDDMKGRLLRAWERIREEVSDKSLSGPQLDGSRPTSDQVSS